MLIILVLSLFIGCRGPVTLVTRNLENRSVSADLAPADSSIIKIYLPYKQEIEKDMGKILAHSSQEMVKDKPESLLTNFLSDLLLAESARTCADQNWNVVPDVAFLNYGGIRTFLPKGNITVGKVFELMPFENELVMVRLKGTDLKKFLDYIAGGGGDAVSGVRFRISDRKASNVEVNGKPLNENGLYWLATSDYIADGGDNYGMLKNRTDFRQMGVKIRDLIIRNLERYGKEGKNLDAKLDGRITNE